MLIDKNINRVLGENTVDPVGARDPPK